MDFELVPLTQVARPRGPYARTTLYAKDKQFPGLLRRMPGVRGTLIHVPTLRKLEAAAVPLTPSEPAAAPADTGHAAA